MFTNECETIKITKLFTCICFIISGCTVENHGFKEQDFFEKAYKTCFGIHLADEDNS